MEKTSLFYLYSYVYELFLVSFMLAAIGFKEESKKLMIFSAFMFFGLLFFFRNNWNLDDDKTKIEFLNPSSSKIVKIERNVNDKNIEFMNEPYTKLSTYLSPFDMHFMVAPCDCILIEKVYKPQRNTDSECMRHIFKNIKDERIFYLDQIVSKPLHWGWIPSVLYDRCVSFIKEGDKLTQGERYGLIRFGSNMEYGLPSIYKVLIKERSKIQIGNTIANIPDENDIIIKD